MNAAEETMRIIEQYVQGELAPIRQELKELRAREVTTDSLMEEITKKIADTNRK